MASGFNVSEEGLLSDRMVREIVPPWSFLLDTMHLYWSNGVVSWEVNALYNLWKDSGHGDLNRFFPWSGKPLGHSRTQSLGETVCAMSRCLQELLTRVRPQTYNFSFRCLNISSMAAGKTMTPLQLPCRVCRPCGASQSNYEALLVKTFNLCLSSKSYNAHTTIWPKRLLAMITSSQNITRGFTLWSRLPHINSM